MNPPAPAADQAPRHATAPPASLVIAMPRHFLSLPQAPTILTPTLDALRTDMERIVAEQAVMCVYGDAGCGKTFALHAALASHSLSSPDLRICHLSPRPAPTPTSLRAELLPAAGLTIPPTHDPGVLDAALRTCLAARPHLLAVDDASRLTTGCVEYLCYLFDDPTTQLALMLVTATSGIRMLRRHPLLATRTAIWFQMALLTPAQIRTYIPRLHPLWHDVDEATLDRLDASYCHGNFRRWAQITHHALRLNRRTSLPTPAVLDGLLDSLAPHEDHR